MTPRELPDYVTRLLREMRVRFERLRRIILQAVIVDDIFALGPPTTSVNEVGIYTNQSPGRRAYEFQTNDQKIKSFISWLNQETQNNVFERRDTQLRRVASGFPVNPNQWTDVYIDSSYQKGIRDARRNLIKQGYVTETAEIGRGRRGAFTETFNTPVHIEPGIGIVHPYL